MLTRPAEAAWLWLAPATGAATTLVVSVVLFDIQGFFDNINIKCITHILHNLGFPPSLCDWIHSFLSDCFVRLSFNRYKSDLINLTYGTPQGSPISPILSAIYTSPLLKLINANWRCCSLNMYVDDRAIFGSAPTHVSSACLVQTGLQDIMGWLFRNGLKCNSDKMEFISFYVTFLGLRRVHFSFSTCLLSLSHHVTNHSSI